MKIDSRKIMEAIDEKNKKVREAQDKALREIIGVGVDKYFTQNRRTFFITNSIPWQQKNQK